MKRRHLLLGAALGSLSWTAMAQTGPLPAVLQRPAMATHLATGAVLLATARAGKRLVVGGERGIMLWSDDNGERWTQSKVPVQVSITALLFSNERDGWAVGHFGVLLRTRDGGQNWTLLMDGVRAAQILLDRAHSDEARKQAQTRLERGADKPFFDLALVDGRLLMVGAYGLALETTDGRSFEPLADRLPNPGQLHVYGLSAAGQRVFAVGEQGLIMRSTDAGARFEALRSPYEGSFFGVITMGDSVVLAYGLRGNIWRSADNGANWVQVSNPVPISINAGTVLADGGIALAAQNGDLFLSQNQGQSFERHLAAPPFPTAALVAAADGQLVLAGLRGLKRQPMA